MKELDKCELQDVEGGLIRWLLVMVIDSVKEIAQEWDDFERSFRSEPYQKSK